MQLPRERDFGITPARKFMARYRPVHCLSVNDIAVMQQLSAAFHEKVDLPAFLRDLQTNDGAILVRDRETNAIGGFIALKKISLSDGSRQAIGIVSGDVIMDPAFGGERALKDAVTRHFLCLWLTSRGVPLYWSPLLKQYQASSLLEDLTPCLIKERRKIQIRRQAAASQRLSSPRGACLD